MSCPSCGQPLAAGAACARCVDEAGAPLGFEPVLARAADELVRTQGLAPEAAEATARAYLQTLPAWRAGGANGVAAVRVRVEAGVGDVEIRGVDGLDAPRLRDGEDDFRLVPHEGGWLVHPKDAEDRWNDACGDVAVDVPRDAAEVAVRMRCGDLDLRDLAGRVEARLQTGDVAVADVGQLTLWVQAGDVEIRGSFGGGESRVELMAGDLDVRLAPGADVRLSLELTAGDAELRGFDYRLERSRAGAQRYEATLGDGRGRLAIVMQAGDAEIVAR